MKLYFFDVIAMISYLLLSLVLLEGKGLFPYPTLNFPLCDNNRHKNYHLFKLNGDC